MTATASDSTAIADTLGDLLDRLGGISPYRVRMHPAPGTATEADVIEIEAREDRRYELIDGVLVEKAMGLRESLIAGAILAALRAFVVPRKLGIVSAPDGMMRLAPGLVRGPDVAFTAVQRLPGGRVPLDRVPRLIPDLAVEVLSNSNTRREMDRKRAEYFGAGVRLVWVVDPNARSVAVYANPGEPVVLRETDVLDGGAVLPGFSMAVRDIFVDLDLGVDQ